MVVDEEGPTGDEQAQPAAPAAPPTQNGVSEDQGGGDPNAAPGQAPTTPASAQQNHNTSEVQQNANNSTTPTPAVSSAAPTGPDVPPIKKEPQRRSPTQNHQRRFLGVPGVLVASLLLPGAPVVYLTFVRDCRLAPEIFS